MSQHTNVYVPDDLVPVIEGLVRASGETSEVPVLSKAEVLRLLLRDSAERLIEGDLDTTAVDDVDGEVDPDDLTGLIPDHKRARYLRERTKDETWLIDMKRGFEGRVRDAMEDRFEGGYDPDGIEEFAETFIEEARIYWLLIEDDEETFREKVEFVRDRVEQYRATFERSTYDPDEEFLAGFSGVQEGMIESEVDDVEEQVRAIAESRYRDGGPSVEALADSIAFAFDLDVEGVRPIVDDVARESMIRDQAAADDSDPSSLTIADEESAQVHDAHAELPDPDRDDPNAVEVDEDEARELRGDDVDVIEADGGEVDR
jgi:hypothetical protein